MRKFDRQKRGKKKIKTFFFIFLVEWKKNKEIWERGKEWEKNKNI